MYKVTIEKAYILAAFEFETFKEATHFVETAMNGDGGNEYTYSIKRKGEEA